MAVKFVLSLLILLALQAAAQETEYFEIGGTLTLNPKYSEAISSITWKHTGNIVAEFINGSVLLEYLGDFKDRAKVDLTTGILTISNMRKSDDGEFTVEINNRVLPDRYNAVGISKLDGYRVEVFVRPLSCNSNADNCSLDCGADFSGAEPVQYSWKKGETGQWEKGEKRITISKATEHFETFTCRVENRFSQKMSAPHNNPYKPKDGGSRDLVLGIVLPLFILAVGSGIIALLIIKKPSCVQNLCSRNSRQSTENGKELEGLNPNSNPESGVTSPP